LHFLLPDRGLHPLLYTNGLSGLTDYKDMIPEDKLLFICTRQNFLDTHKKAVIDLCDREKINWERVYATAKLHGVAPLIYLNLQKCSGNGLIIPNDIANKFKLYIYTRKILEEKWEDYLKDALDFFHQH